MVGCFYSLAACIAPANTIKARPQSRVSQANSSSIPPSPVSKVGVVFDYRVLPSSCNGNSLYYLENLLDSTDQKLQRFPVPGTEGFF